MNYAFTTTGQSGLAVGPATLIAPGEVVSGTFVYDSDAPALATIANGSSVYGESFNSLSGSVAGLTFSAASGFTTVGNEVLPAERFAEPVDFFQLAADPAPNTPSGPSDLIGFTLGDFVLVNVRLFFIETFFNTPDFLDDQSLLPAPPTFQGRLALDFQSLSNPTGPLLGRVIPDYEARRERLRVAGRRWCGEVACSTEDFADHCFWRDLIIL